MNDHVASLQYADFVRDHQHELAQEVDERRLDGKGVRAGVSVYGTTCRYDREMTMVLTPGRGLWTRRRG